VNLSQLFIQRPIMTVLVCFAIVLFGAVAFRALPVAALPSVDYPTIQVQCVPAGSQSRDHGIHGGDASGAGVLDHRRHLADEFDQLAGQHFDYGAVFR